MLKVTCIVSQTGKDLFGVVLDDNDKPIVNAALTIPELGLGLFTNQEGKFEISIPQNIFF